MTLFLIVIGILILILALNRINHYIIIRYWRKELKRHDSVKFFLDKQWKRGFIDKFTHNGKRVIVKVYNYPGNGYTKHHIPLSALTPAYSSRNFERYARR